MASPEQDYATAASRILESLGAGQAAAALQAGQIQAEAQRQRGQIWGQALSQIGGQIGNLPMQIAQQKEAAQKQQFGAIQLEQARAAQAGQTSANALIASLPKTSDGLFDTSSLQQQLAAKNVPLSIAEPLLSSADKMNEIHRKTMQDKLDRYADVADVVLSAHKPGDPITPDALDMGFELAKHIGLTTDAEKPAFLQSMAQSGVDPESALKGIRRLSKKYADQEKPTFAPRESPGYMQGNQFHPIDIAAHNPTPASLDAAYQTLKAKEALATAGKGEPLTDAEQAQIQGYEARVSERHPGGEKGLQSKSVLLDGKPAEVSYDPATGKLYKGGKDGEDVTERAKPMPPASVVYPQMKADKLVKVEHKDPATGRTVIEWLPQSELRGQTFEKGTGSTLEARLASAQSVNQTGDDIIKQLADPKVRAAIGPLMGRASSLRDFLGNPPPEYSELAGAIESYALANMGVHGMRSAQGAEQIKKLLDAHHTPESLIGAIKGLQKFSSHFMQNEGYGGKQDTPATGNQTTPSAGGLTYQDYLHSKKGGK